MEADSGLVERGIVVIEWVRENDALVWVITAIGLVTFIATIVAIPLLVAQLPVDYFTRRPVVGWPARRPALHLMLVLAKNLLGLLLLIAGLAMIVLPGQGLLTMFIGLLLIDFPGKRRLELWLIRRPWIRRAVTWVRRRHGKPPLKLPGGS